MSFGKNKPSISLLYGTSNEVAWWSDITTNVYTQEEMMHVTMSYKPYHYGDDSNKVGWDPSP